MHIHAALSWRLEVLLWTYRKIFWKWVMKHDAKHALSFFLESAGWEVAHHSILHRSLSLSRGLLADNCALYCMPISRGLHADRLCWRRVAGLQSRHDIARFLSAIYSALLIYWLLILKSNWKGAWNLEANRTNLLAGPEETHFEREQRLSSPAGYPDGQLEPPLLLVCIALRVLLALRLPAVQQSRLFTSGS